MLMENLPCWSSVRLPGDVQAQAAALGAAGGVAADKALHELLRADIERRAGDVLHRDDRLAPFDVHVNVDAGLGQGVFDDVVEEVVYDPPQQPPVGHYHGTARGC